MTDYKAIQAALNAKGASPALAVDGSWGPKSQAALRAFQASHGLVVDGVPGPKSLAALGLAAASAAAAAPKGNPDDLWAYQVAKRAAPTMPEGQLQYALSVSRGEGRFGLGWGAPIRDETAAAFAQQHGLTGKEGVGSNNWGAEQGTGDAGSFPHVDFGWRNPDGTPWNGKGPKVWLPYIGKYKRWSSPEKGFQSVAKTLYGGGKRGAAGAAELQAAIGRGDLKAAVYAQHANGYFELDPDKYLSAVARNYAAMTDATGWRGVFGEVASVMGVLLGLIVTTAIGGAVWWYVKTKGGT